MNRRKVIVFLVCLLISAANITACSKDQKKENAKGGQTTQKKESTKAKGELKKTGLDNAALLQTKDNNSKIALKNWNEASHRLPGVQHRQEVLSLSQQFPGIVFYKGNPRVKRVALTFDDGPDNYYTPRILDILRAKKVPGTFFMVGSQVKRYPDMARRIVKEGNAVGNHSWDHPKLWSISNDKIKQEILSAETAIQKVTGQRPTLFRPPYGRVTPADVVLIHNMGYRIIDWSVDTLDWKGTPAPAILQFVNKEASPGGIILEHCLAGHPGELNGTLQALPHIIDNLRAQGYEFVTVQTLLGP